MQDKKVLFGICGSFCNHAHILHEIRKMVKKNDVQVIVSNNVYEMDTRFFQHDTFINELKNITKHDVWHTLQQGEAIAREKFDIMVIAPMSASVASKLMSGDYDHPVALAAKAILRNNKNIVYGFASNDGLGISAKNLASLLNCRGFYAIPFQQDDPFHKGRSVVACWYLVEKTCDYALKNEQIQPILWRDAYE